MTGTGASSACWKIRVRAARVAQRRGDHAGDEQGLPAPGRRARRRGPADPLGRRQRGRHPRAAGVGDRRRRARRGEPGVPQRTQRGADGVVPVRVVGQPVLAVAGPEPVGEPDRDLLDQRARSGVELRRLVTGRRAAGRGAGRRARPASGPARPSPRPAWSSARHGGRRTLAATIGPPAVTCPSQRRGAGRHGDTDGPASTVMDLTWCITVPAVETIGLPRAQPEPVQSDGTRPRRGVAAGPARDDPILHRCRRSNGRSSADASSGTRCGERPRHEHWKRADRHLLRRAGSATDVLLARARDRDRARAATSTPPAGSSKSTRRSTRRCAPGVAGSRRPGWMTSELAGLEVTRSATGRDEASQSVVFHAPHWQGEPASARRRRGLAWRPIRS